MTIPGSNRVTQYLGKLSTRYATVGKVRLHLKTATPFNRLTALRKNPVTTRSQPGRGEFTFHLRNELPDPAARLVTVSLQICVYG